MLETFLMCRDKTIGHICITRQYNTNGRIVCYLLGIVSCLFFTSTITSKSDHAIILKKLNGWIKINVSTILEILLCKQKKLWVLTASQVFVILPSLYISEGESDFLYIN